MVMCVHCGKRKAKYLDYCNRCSKKLVKGGL